VGQTQPHSELLRVLGLFFGLAAVLGGSVGQGILRQPGVVAAAVPQSALILALWVLGGLIAAVNAMPLAELGSALPRAGGPYVFVHRAFGKTTGAITGWADYLINLSSQAFMAVVVAEFIHRLGAMSAVPVPLLAPAIIAAFFLVNLTHTKTCGSTQMIGSVIKGVSLFALVALLFTFGSPHDAARIAQPSPHSTAALSIGAFALAMRAVQNTYDGWNNCVYFSEEMKEPHRQVPRSLFGGIALVTCIYVLVNAALIYSLGSEGMAASNLPAAEALAGAVGDWAGTLMTLFGVVSVAAILNLNVMFGPRIALAMSRDTLLPRHCAKVRPNGAPAIALTVGTAIAAALAASGTYQDLIAFNVALGFAVNSAVCLAAFQLRRTEKELPRPWRMAAYPWPVIVAVGVNMALLVAMIAEDTFHSLAGIFAAILIGVGYRMFHRSEGAQVAAA
jgi:APA family basic amino acid/polyamine antiporter